MPADLPPRVLAVLEAMTQPDPLPPAMLDGPAVAIRRRLCELTEGEAAEILRPLSAFGLTKVPFVAGMLSLSGAAHLTKWITEHGWAALGVGLGRTTN